MKTKLGKRRVILEGGVFVAQKRYFLLGWVDIERFVMDNGKAITIWKYEGFDKTKPR